jgi:hypothetical protein
MPIERDNWTFHHTTPQKIWAEKAQDTALKKKRHEIAKGKQKITTQDLSVGNAINAILKRKANGAAYNEIANRLNINANENTEIESDYSGRKGAFIKPPVATVQWQTIVRKKKPAKSRPTNCCFKCFIPGHYKRQCNNIIKCFKCGRSGHTHYKCKETKPAINKETQAQFGQKTKGIQSKTSQMTNNLFYVERPDITTVYFERRDHMNQHTQFLHRSGLVTFRNGAPLPQRRHQVAAALARRIGWHPQDYEVYDSGIVNYIIIFPGPLNRNQAVRCNPYKLSDGTEFDVHAWEPAFNMVYMPPQFRTWLTLRVPPFQTWSRTDITRLVQRFGSVQQIMPFGVNAGHFREVRVIIQGEHPIDIHRQIMFREGDYATVIDVHIHRWEAIAHEQPPPPNSPR